MAENVPNKGEETDTQEAQSSLWEELKISLPRHVITKIKSSRENLKNSKRRKKKDIVMYKGTSIGLSSEFSAETLQVRREYQDIFKVVKEKNFSLRIYPEWPPFRTEGERKSFP